MKEECTPVAELHCKKKGGHSVSARNAFDLIASSDHLGTESNMPNYLIMICDLTALCTLHNINNTLNSLRITLYGYHSCVLHNIQ